MDFFEVRYRTTKRGSLEVYPNFIVCDSNDLMVRGREFYAIWNEQSGLWSHQEFDVTKLVDKELFDFAEELRQKTADNINVLRMGDFEARSWMNYRTYISKLPDNFRSLDDRLIFADQKTTREDYASRKLPYSLSEGECPCWDELVGVLYTPQERKKIEWAIGSVFAGESKDIQKFFVFYGDAGTGKSTILNIIQWLFNGYYAVFDAKALGNAHNQFSMEAFKNNPLVAIQHDGDLSRIEDNTRLNSIVSHEEMLVNEKHKALYSVRMNAMLFMGTNKPVKITDAKSGIIRRLIDITPTGEKIPVDHYQKLMHNIKFELGAIAQHCLNVYKTLGKHHYDNYRASEMQYKTDVFFNFVDANFFEFKKQDYVSLKQAYAMYKEYCQETSLSFVMPMYQFREELKNYFREFQKDYRTDDGKHIRSCYVGFLASKIEYKPSEDFEEMKPISDWLEMNTEHSLFDIFARDYPAQYAGENETPLKKWSSVDTTLADIDTKKLHYVQVPTNHIVIDFDLRGDDGEKSAELNIAAANKWPPTYAEFSKGGAGVHLHYIYDGDVEQLSRVYSEGIEVKVFNGNSSLRRRLSLCNDISIAHISGGLPTKERKVISNSTIKSERALRDMVVKNLKKEVHPNTKPSVDFIYKILDDAYNSGMEYDISDMHTAVLAFAANSTHQAKYCMDLVAKMHFVSKDLEERRVEESREDKPIVFFDIEVFPNLLLVNYKAAGDSPMVRMINPDPNAIEELFQYRLIGFNNRRYDNHILYARYLGHSIEECYLQSQKIINGDRDAFFTEAYRLSYTDVYDFSSKKQSLKKFEIELGIHHQELGLPWDEPVDPKRWTEVAEYCDNDVIATEAVFNARQADFVAREILADLSGLTVNDTTNQHTTRIIFGDDPNPQSKFVYTDLSEMFPGYKFEGGHSSYRGEDPGEGGYVYSEPGMYSNVALIDVASMHPTSIENLNLFGPYTKRFSAIKQARVAIKHHDYASARDHLEVINYRHVDLDRYLSSEELADKLAFSLKIVINSVYGLTSAKFPNKFKDPRNVDNIVAKRGALFMIDLKHAVQEKGWTVAHIKTDSIKIPDATPEMIQFVIDFGKKYGYDFEHEATYSKLCLVNKSTYIAKCADGKHAGEWTATGAQFQQPYVFKTLFSKEPLIFDDMCETKTCKTAFYLDMNEGMPDGEHNYTFVGRAGQFTPVKAGVGGGRLVREQSGKYYSATDADGFRWLESETVRRLGLSGSVDRTYYDRKVDDAVADISEYGDFEWFVG